MRIAITGGTGFLGGALARRLGELGHGVVVLSRKTGLADPEVIAEAIRGCDALVHCAGINREKGGETFEEVHVQGTENTVAACRIAGVRRIALVSFLRARPSCGSGYHESKFAAEEIVRGSGLDWRVFKPGIIFGEGGHVLKNLARAFGFFPVFALVGLRPRMIRPVAGSDMVELLVRAAVEDGFKGRTIAVVGEEAMTMREFIRRAAAGMGAKVFIFPMPVIFHEALAACCEFFMPDPLLSRSQVKMFAEGMAEPLGPFDEIFPTPVAFTPKTIRPWLPDSRGEGGNGLIWNAETKS
jgi:NADH dehydrogenase